MAVLRHLFHCCALCFIAATIIEAWMPLNGAELVRPFSSSATRLGMALADHHHGQRVRRKLMLAEGKEARIASRTVPIAHGWGITVWEWEKPAAVVETYWAVEQQGLALTASGRPPMASRTTVLDPFGLVTWPGAVVAAQELLEHHWVVKDKRVLILGAGVGIEAQAAALLGAASVLATDIHPTTIQLLEYGAQQAGLDDIISTQLFDICAAEDLPDCDILIVSDVLYNERLAKQVAWRCAEARKQKPPAVVLVSDSQRFVHFETDLNKMLQKTGDSRVAWEPRWLEKFQGSGVMIDEDILYDVKARIIWIGLDE